MVLKLLESVGLTVPAAWDASKQTGPYLDSAEVHGSSELSYKRTPIPTPQDVARMVAEMKFVPATGPVDVALPVDISLRFALLAYSRNSAAGTLYTLLRSEASGEVEAIEIQLHGTDDFQAGAHLVVYIYRMQGGGVEVVLTYKGSTLNAEDWAHNLHFLKVGDDMSVHRGVNLFPDLTGAETQRRRLVRDAKVHTGFLEYKRTLDARMAEFSMEPLLGLLGEWGAPTTHCDLYGWLHSPEGSWKRATVIGHSLGGAMATIAAVELSVRCTSADRHAKGVMLATFAAPAAGDEAFVAVQNARVGPAGGLRIHNQGDAVPMLGYSGAAVRPTSEKPSKYHGGLEVPLWGRAQHQMDPYHIHLRFTVISTVNTKKASPRHGHQDSLQWVTCKFPGTTYKPSATDDYSQYTLGDHWTVAGDGPVKVDSFSDEELHRVANPLAAIRAAKRRVAKVASSARGLATSATGYSGL